MLRYQRFTMRGPALRALSLLAAILIRVTPVDAAFPGALRSALETEADTVFQRIDAIEESHISGNALYWQAVAIHSVTPSDGAQRAPDRLNAAVGTLQSWEEKQAVFGPGTISNYEVHQYSGPRGKGYIIFQSVISGGVTYRRAVDRGPEGRDSGWTAIGP